DDYVIATCETHSVKEFVKEAFQLLGLDWREHVELDPRYLRPSEVDLLLGDFSKAEKDFGWKPKVGFKELVRIMVEADVDLAKREAHMRNYPAERTATAKVGAA
ncbi:MAG: GDP-mannose 4,6-dehydratase, partial [Candidatus Binatia bacterium]